MDQLDRMNSASDGWEADPWDAPAAVADNQMAGFRERAVKSIPWTSVCGDEPLPFAIEKQKLSEFDVEYCATHDGEDMLLMQMLWHGFPDPPEWRLATRPSGSDASWTSWGYFAEIPRCWQLPSKGK